MLHLFHLCLTNTTTVSMDTQETKAEIYWSIPVLRFIVFTEAVPTFLESGFEINFGKYLHRAVLFNLGIATPHGVTWD